MSKIGFYKPSKRICWSQNEDDHSAISVEITRIIEIFATNGHECYILSDTDYIPGAIKNVFTGVLMPLDKVFVYNGPGLTHAIVDSMQALSSNIVLIITDMSLLPVTEVIVRFTDVFTQSKHFMHYGAIEEHECYGFEPFKQDKDIHFYFGGTERGRTQDFFEYVYRPGQLWHGKSQTLGIKNYVPYHEHIDLMKRTKYSIIIGDEEYNDIGFVTPRYYECVKYGIIPFVDSKFDPDEILISHSDFRRVFSYIEMINKMRLLDQNFEMYQTQIHKQNHSITYKQISGQNILKLLL